MEFSNVKEDAVTLTWKVPLTDGGLPIKEYIIEQRDITKSMWVRSGSVAGDRLTFTATKLSEGTEYKFRVSAVNDEGEGPALESADSVTAERPKSKESFFVIKFIPHLGNNNKDRLG